jgi:hypothetical protein
MNTPSPLFVLLGAVCLACPILRADVVELKDGTRIEGLILSETASSLEIQIGANPAGTIRRVLQIDASEIRSYVADAEGRVRNDPRDVLRLEGNAYLERLIRDAEIKVSEKDFPAAIRQFQEVAELAGRDDGPADTEDKVHALELRAHACRLLLATYEGKVEMLETRIKGDGVQVKAEKKELEKKWEELQDEIAADKKEREGARRAELGARHFVTDLQKREDELRARISAVVRREQEIAEQNKAFDEERIKTEAEIRLTEERVKQAESSAKNARAALKKRK